MHVDHEMQAADLQEGLRQLWQVAGTKITSIDASSARQPGAPVFTIDGQYTAQGWTEWTQGFQFGAALLQYDATGDRAFLDLGRENTRRRMAPHVTHVGVHDHGFNIVSTFGNLRRLMLEERMPHDPRELECYELALKASGAVQAARWSETCGDDGYIYSFNGPHSLFCDTIRSLRSLALAHRLGHVLMEENDQRVSLLERLVQHARTTARYSVYYGQGRDIYDVRGRVAHESIFNVNDGHYRCPSTQQGYSPFSTWTRGLAWVMVGYPEQLEFLATVTDRELEPYGGRAEIEAVMLGAARASCDFYLENTPADGVPYWDTAAPGLSRLGDYRNRPAEPENDAEPVDSSAAAIAAQGLLRLGRWLRERGDAGGDRYWQAGLTVLKTLLAPPYLCLDAAHQGLLLHALYHRPRGWDHVPPGAVVPCGEACIWGDYHLLEVALYVHRILHGHPYYTFFAPPAAA
jgi:hypothetical protein